MVIALLLLIAASDSSVHGRSRTTIVVGSQPSYSSEARALQLKTFAPIVEEVFLDAAPGVRELRIVVDAWTAFDAGDRVFAERALADLTQAYLQWRTRTWDARAGRVFLYSETGRGRRIDGGVLGVRGGSSSFTIGGEAWLGLPVSTAYGDEPLRHALPSASADPLFYAPRGSDWSRPGDLAFGARLEGGAPGLIDLGLGYAQERNLTEVDREALLARVHLAPWSFVALDAFGSFDVYAEAIEDAELNLSYWPVGEVRAAAYARHRAPALSLPSTSIFSVFAGETHAELGVEADWFVAGTARLSGSAELRRATIADGGGSELGYRVTASARSRVWFWPGASGLVSYERLSDGWFGRYDYLRASAEVPLSEAFALAPDAGVFLVERTGEENHFAGRLGLAATLKPGADLSFVLAGRATRGAGGDGELAVIGRIEWNVEHTF